MIDLIASACITVESTVYCEQTTNQQMPISDQQMSLPIHVLDTSTMTDPAYGEIFFDLSSVKDQNDCVNSLLYHLEKRKQVPGQEYCSEMIYGAFGNKFVPNSQTAVNIFKMIAHHVYAVQKREFKLPLGLDRRLKAQTGLTTF